MSEIEKMCENTRVYDFRYDCDVSFSDGDFGRVTNCSKGEIKDYCIDKKYFKGAKVINVRHLYPPFTAEKQLELVKWCCDARRRYIIYRIKSTEHFDEKLAFELNTEWEHLTKEEQEQIRSILKGV